MRKKYIPIWLVFGIQLFSGLEAQAFFMGLGPFPWSFQAYQTNPVFKMTPGEKEDVEKAFSWAASEFKKNRAHCNNRTTCLTKDLKTLKTFINKRPNHPAKTLFEKIHRIIRRDSQHQKFTTQWIIFQNLSPRRQEEYQNGIRVTPIKPQSVKSASGKIVPAIFNRDDILTRLLAKIDHKHKNCERYVACLSSDIQVIKGLRNRLAPIDPSRKLLTNLARNIENLASQKIFDTSLYLKLYNPLKKEWDTTLTKHKVRKTTIYGYEEWKEIAQTSEPVSWRAPRITNGQPIKKKQPPKPKASPPQNTFQTWHYGGTGTFRIW